MIVISRHSCSLQFGVASCLAAQDTRTVIEPFFPQLCTTRGRATSTDGHSLASADEQKLDTARIQRAIDKCGRGRAVMLHVDETNNAFLSGPLELKPDVTLIVGLGVTLFASRDPAVFAVSPGSCGIVSHSPGPRGCKPLISVDHAPDSGVMGDGVIDGRGGEKMLGLRIFLVGSGRASARRRWPAGSAPYRRHDSDNFTLYRITLRNSPNFHVVYNHGDGFTVWGLKIDTPQRLARNTDGVDPGDGAKNVTITHSYIRAGDDNVAIKGGPGGATNMTISHDHFYWGHGMSIGSETYGGVSKIRVFDLSLDGPDNGIRIKSNGSRGGLTAERGLRRRLHPQLAQPHHARYRVLRQRPSPGRLASHHARHHAAQCPRLRRRQDSPSTATTTPPHRGRAQRRADHRRGKIHLRS